MQQHKLIVVDNADQLVKEAARPLMERYADGDSAAFERLYAERPGDDVIVLDRTAVPA